MEYAMDVELDPLDERHMGLDDATEHLYRNKVILAPMVRAGTLPFRALALRYGADTVYTEEVIDRRVVNAVRTDNPVLGTVDYVESRGKKGTAIPFQTCPALERTRLVYQIGTGDATNALRAAQHVERDVAAVDVNMGCPKRFSVQGGMGSALLKQPELAADIVGTLRRNLSVPVSAKIRLLDTPEETVEFARRMEKAGACALAVHVRRVEDKPASKARWEELRPVVDALNIPVIANGDVYTRADMANIKAVSGCSSVMLARPALLNCSVFKADGKVLPLKEVIQQYLRECFRYDSVYQNAKYTVMEMLTKRRHPDHLKESICLGLPKSAPGMREVTPAKTLSELAKLWDVGADYVAEMDRRAKRAEGLGEGSAIEPVERNPIHKFNDAYFLEPEAAAAAAAANASDSRKGTSSRSVIVFASHGESEEGRIAEDVGDMLAATAAAPTKVTAKNGGGVSMARTSCSALASSSSTAAGPDATPADHHVHGHEDDKERSCRGENGRENGGVTVRSIGGWGGSNARDEETTRSSVKGEPSQCHEKGGDGSGGKVAGPPVGALAAVVREKQTGGDGVDADDGVCTQIPGSGAPGEAQRERRLMGEDADSGGVAPSAERGVVQRAGPRMSGFVSDDVSGERRGVAPTRALTSSKRPREEETCAPGSLL